MLPLSNRLLCLATGLLLATVAWAEQNQQFESQAKKAIRASDWSSLASISRQWVEAEPDSAPANWLRAYSAVAGNDVRSATPRFSLISNSRALQAIRSWSDGLAETSPHSALACLLWADVLARDGELAEAVKALDKAIELDPESALAHDLRGVVNVLADSPSATMDFEKAVDLQPNFADALTNLGILRLTNGDFLGAKDYLDRAIAIAPESAVALNARGVTHAYLHAWVQSEADLARAKELEPKLAFLEDNARVLTWLRGQERFRRSRTATDSNDRGTTLVVQQYDRYSVPLGDGRSYC